MLVSRLLRQGAILLAVHEPRAIHGRRVTAPQHRVSLRERLWLRRHRLRAWLAAPPSLLRAPPSPGLPFRRTWIFSPRIPRSSWQRLLRQPSVLFPLPSLRL